MVYLFPLFLLTVGLLLLSIGAEGLIEGSLRLSRIFAISPLVVGLTIVAFGTSAPELAVSLIASFKGSLNVALGNVLGSNIANTLLITGIGALIRPFSSNRYIIKRDLPFLFIISLIIYYCGFIGSINLWYGAIVIFLFIAYLVYMYKTKADKYIKQNEQEETKKPVKNGDYDLMAIFISIFLIIIGLLALIYGSNIFLKGALQLGRLIGVPELFIGLTITALGTSLPEIATTVSASRRGEGNIIMGNVIGSNIANLCIVLGIASFILPIPVPAVSFKRDIPMLIITTILLGLLVLNGKKINRIEGAIFLLLYVAYIRLLLY